MNMENVIKTQRMWKDYPNTQKWIETIQSPEIHIINGKPDSDYIKAVESLSYILLGIETPI